MKKVVILISGAGSLLESFAQSEKLEVVEVIANKSCAGLEVAEKLGLRARVIVDFDKKLATSLNEEGVEVVVLAGFLKILEGEFIENFRGIVVNVHPSLLPKYGGVGFYGKKVHQAVIEEKEDVSGITIHKVTSEVDEGEIVAQFEVKLSEDESVDSLEQKIRRLEKAKYVTVVENLV